MKRILILGSLSVLVAGICIGFFLLKPSSDNPVQHAFIEAARKGDVQRMSDLLARGAIVDREASYEHGAISGGPALCDAIFSQQPESVRWLLDHGAQVNQVFGTDTPLEVAEHCLRESPHRDTALAIVELLRTRGGKRLSELHQ